MSSSVEFSPPKISLNDSIEKIASELQTFGNIGVFHLEDVPAAPFQNLQGMFEKLKKIPSLGERLNNAYKNNLVYKDSFAAGKGGDEVDMKRVLDLSPERIQEILSREPSLLTGEESHVIDLIIAQFWMDCTEKVSQKMMDAIASAIGSKDIVKDVHYNYRSVDYYERSIDSIPPRCGEHRDFGTFTLIFPDSPGLQVKLQSDSEWLNVVTPQPGSAILIFGWCTQICSNGRISAALHRVVDSAIPSADHMIPRRTSAVLFVAPKEATTCLTPIVFDGEIAKYKSGILVGQLRGSMARKWMKREGTLKEVDRIWEEQDILINGNTQDEVVKRNYELLPVH